MNSYITVSIVQQNLYFSKKVINNSYATVVMYSRGGTLYTHIQSRQRVIRDLSHHLRDNLMKKKILDYNQHRNSVLST